jgi:kynurenine formamidase
MVKMFDLPVEMGEPLFAGDFFGTEIHGDCRTHVDALCHVAYRGRLYNSKSPSIVTSKGATTMDITALSHGIVGRGVLLDLPRQFGVKWLEPGHAVTTEELEAAEKAQGVRLTEGDILLFRTGHSLRRIELGSWNNGYDGEGQAGLHATAIRMLHDRKVAAFFPDGDGETIPANVEGVAYPIHALQIAAMGMVCADSLQFEELVGVCEEHGRWEFLVCAAPLRIPSGTGSPFNPIAVL